MAEDLKQLEAWAGALLAKLSEPARRRLARQVAVALRRANVMRIAGQRNPDGSAFTPRKRRAEPLRSKAGKLKRRAAARAGGPMFKKLRGGSFLTAKGAASEASVGFTGSTLARIARVHQEGLRDKVERKAGAPEVDYAQRQLLGFTDEDRARLLDQVLAQLDV